MALDAKYTFFRFSKTARKLVLDNLADTSIRNTYSNMNNRLYALKDKGWLHEDEDGQLALRASMQMLLTKLENNNFAMNILF
jgi:hypothetical protein